MKHYFKCEIERNSSCTDLSPLGPKGRIQLAMRKKAVLQAGQELEQVASSREAKWRSLDTVLTNQHHCPTTINCKRYMGDYVFI